METHPAAIPAVLASQRCNWAVLWRELPAGNSWRSTARCSFRVPAHFLVSHKRAIPASHRHSMCSGVRSFAKRVREDVGRGEVCPADALGVEESAGSRHSDGSKGRGGMNHFLRLLQITLGCCHYLYFDGNW